MTAEGRRVHNNNLSEDTFAVLRDGRRNGNEIRKNSREIVEREKTEIHIAVPSVE